MKYFSETVKMEWYCYPIIGLTIQGVQKLSVQLYTIYNYLYYDLTILYKPINLGTS